MTGYKIPPCSFQTCQNEGATWNFTIKERSVKYYWLFSVVLNEMTASIKHTALSAIVYALVFWKSVPPSQ